MRERVFRHVGARLPAVRSLLDVLAAQFAALCRVEPAYERDADAALARTSRKPDRRAEVVDSNLARASIK